ncbi:hypothetical protein BT69DRAFT_1331320 [Atractiella rhizophila]|nr:hypothetical protein BT69DRAFT_1331320 [Atractiella rhizophila]
MSGDGTQKATLGPTLLTLPYDVLHLIFTLLRFPRRLSTNDLNFVDPNRPDYEPPSVYLSSLRVHRNLHPVAYPVFLSHVQIFGEVKAQKFLQYISSSSSPSEMLRGEMVQNLLISLDERIHRQGRDRPISSTTFERIIMLTTRLRSFTIANFYTELKGALGSIADYDAAITRRSTKHWERLEEFRFYGTRQFVRTVYPLAIPLFQNWAFDSTLRGSEEAVDDGETEGGKKALLPKSKSALKKLAISVRDWTFSPSLVPTFQLTSCSFSNIYISDSQLAALLSSSILSLSSLTLEELRCRPSSESFALHQSLSSLPHVLQRFVNLRTLKLKTTLSDHSKMAHSAPFREIYPYVSKHTTIQRLDILVDDFREEVILNLPPTLQELFCCFPFGLGEFWLPLGRLLQEGNLGTLHHSRSLTNGKGSAKQRLQLKVLRHHYRQPPNAEVREECDLRNIKIEEADWFDI